MAPGGKIQALADGFYRHPGMQEQVLGPHHSFRGDKGPDAHAGFLAELLGKIVLGIPRRLCQLLQRKLLLQVVTDVFAALPDFRTDLGLPCFFRHANAASLFF